MSLEILPSELNSLILSHLDPVLLQRAALISRVMNQIAIDPVLWRGFLSKDVRDGAVDPRLDVIKAIIDKQYIKLSPECLLNMLYEDTIEPDSFDYGCLDALRVKYDNVASQKITLLVSNNIKQLYQSGMKPEDFAMLTLEQTYAIIGCSVKIFFIKYGLTPQDFSMLDPAQIQAVSCLEGRYSTYYWEPEIAFIRCGLMPQDFTMLAPEQIKAAVTYYVQEILSIKFGPEQLALKPEELIKFTPKGIIALSAFKFNSEQLNNFISHPLESIFTAEYLDVIKAQEEDEILLIIETLAMGEDNAVVADCS